jgi:TIR domain
MPLSASKRATLVKEVGKRLGAEEWPFIDATLNAFSLPTSNDWPGNALSYTLRMIEGATDETLMELAEHVGFQFGARPIRVDPPFWRSGMLRLFITHLSAHKVFAAELQSHLHGYGISSFVAHNDIEPTKEWQNEIETALSTCEAVVALLHAGFHESNWTDQEIGYGMGRGIPVYSVRFGQDPYGFIGRFQAFTGGEKKAIVLAAELFEALRKDKQTQHRMADVLVDLFVGSNSFKEAKIYMGHLDGLLVWESSYPARLRSAVKHNDQVSGSFGVPERVEALIKKWAK